MKRSRSLSKWSSQTHYMYKSASDLLSSPCSPGVHTLAVEGQYLDMLIEDRKSRVTLVVFHSALSPAIVTTPLFQGQSLAAAFEVNLVSVADPSVGLEGLSLGWHIGNREIGPLKPILSPILRHALESLGTERAILFGSSGGGYAAIHYGDVFPKSTVFVVNSRLDLGARPHKAFQQYAFYGYKAGKAISQRKLLDKSLEYNPAVLFSDGLPFELCLFQNTGDTVYLEHQLMPFANALARDPHLHVRLEFTGKGHSGVPRTLLLNMVEPLLARRSTSRAINDAGFTPAANVIDLVQAD